MLEEELTVLGGAPQCHGNKMLENSFQKPVHLQNIVWITLACHSRTFAKTDQLFTNRSLNQMQMDVVMIKSGHDHYIYLTRASHALLCHNSKKILYPPPLLLGEHLHQTEQLLDSTPFSLSPVTGEALPFWLYTLAPFDRAQPFYIKSMANN